MKLCNIYGFFLYPEVTSLPQPLEVGTCPPPLILISSHSVLTAFIILAVTPFVPPSQLVRVGSSRLQLRTGDACISSQSSLSLSSRLAFRSSAQAREEAARRSLNPYPPSPNFPAIPPARAPNSPGIARRVTPQLRREILPAAFPRTRRRPRWWTPRRKEAWSGRRAPGGDGYG